jgi:hypothetical protein
MKLKRIEPGLYRSTDGIVEIRKHISPQSRGPDEVSWGIRIFGKDIFMDQDTKRDAIAFAERFLKEKK